MNNTALLLLLATGLTKYATDLVKFVCERKGWLCTFSPDGFNLGMIPRALALSSVPVGSAMTLLAFWVGGVPIRENVLFCFTTSLGAIGYHEGLEAMKAKNQ